MPRFPLAVVAALAGVAAFTPSASAAAPPPGAQISDSLTYESRTPDAKGITEGKFDSIGKRDILIATGTFGFKVYDVSKPTQPKLLDTFQPAEILGEQGYWQDEDMDIDPRRKLIIGSLDPRHDDVNQTDCPGIGQLSEKNRNPKCRSGVFVISYADPSNLKQVGDFIELPAGHTTSCVDHCRYLWTGGPARRDDQAYLGPFTPGERGDGRPIWVTDLRDPNAPKVYPEPDRPRSQRRPDRLLARRRRRQEGHRLDERPRRPARLRDRGPRARPEDGQEAQRPALEARARGGRRHRGRAERRRPAADRLHPQLGPPDGRRSEGEGRPQGQRRARDGGGLHDSLRPGRAHRRGRHHRLVGGGPAAGSTPEKPYRMKALSAFHPSQDTPETTAPITECSAHYFEVSGSTLAAGWYGQGLRLIDASNARNLRQVGFYYVTGTDEVTNPSSLSWDTAFRGKLVYLFDHARGIEVLKMRGGPGKSSRLKTADRATGVQVGRDRLAARPVESAGTSYVCPAFRIPGQS